MEHEPTESKRRDRYLPNMCMHVYIIHRKIQLKLIKERHIYIYIYKERGFMQVSNSRNNINNEII